MKFRDKYPLEPIRYLGWKQPFASLMLHGKIETRSWDTKYRGWVLITASKTPYTFSKAIEISGDAQYYRAYNTLKVGGAQGLRDTFGKAIAIGRLCSSEQMGDFAGQEKTIEDKCFVQYNPDLWMHEYTEVQPIQPFEIKGAQGWRKLDEETIDKIILINPIEP